MPFERFTEQAQDILRRAQELVLRGGGRELDTPHLLVAMFEAPDSQAVEVCKRLGVDPALLARRARQAALGGRAAGGAPTNALYITPRARRALDQAVAEADRRGDQYVAVEHIFLALLTDTHHAGAPLAAPLRSGRTAAPRSVGERASGRRRVARTASGRSRATPHCAWRSGRPPLLWPGGS